MQVTDSPRGPQLSQRIVAVDRQGPELAIFAPHLGPYERGGRDWAVSHLLKGKGQAQNLVTPALTVKQKNSYIREKPERSKSLKDIPTEPTAKEQTKPNSFSGCLAGLVAGAHLDVLYDVKHNR